MKSRGRESPGNSTSEEQRDKSHPTPRRVRPGPGAGGKSSTFEVKSEVKVGMCWGWEAMLAKRTSGQGKSKFKGPEVRASLAHL